TFDLSKPVAIHLAGAPLYSSRLGEGHRSQSGRPRYGSHADLIRDADVHCHKITFDLSKPVAIHLAGPPLYGSRLGEGHRSQSGRLRYGSHADLIRDADVHCYQITFDLSK